MTLEDIEKARGEVRKAIERCKKSHGFFKLLLMEKQRRGAGAEKLVFVGVANIAKHYWCAGQSLIQNMVMEPSYFASYLVDRLLYSRLLGYVKRLPKTPDEILRVGEDLSMDDVERLLEVEGEAKHVSREGVLPEDVDNESAELEWRAALIRGVFLHATAKERYPTVRWNFPWRDYVVVGVPDGITKEFVYEFKTTRSEYLACFLKRVALTQGDLYGTFFKRPKKRVQLYVCESDRTFTYHEPVSAGEAEAVLRKFEATDEARVFQAPKPWKCKACRYRGKWCVFKGDRTVALNLPSLPILQLNLDLSGEAPPRKTIEENRKIIEENRYYFQTRDILTLLKVLRKCILYCRRGDSKRFRFFLGLTRRELNYLHERLPSSVVQEVENIFKIQDAAELERAESNVRAAITAHLENTLPPEWVGRFLKSLAEQDSQIEKKI